MNQAFHLYRLQQIDSQIDQASAAISDLDQLLAGDDSIVNARQSLAELRKLLHHDQQSLKEVEAAVREQQIKIAQNESSLYSGKVRNPKELQDLQKEIDSLKKYLSQLEDKQLEIMIAVEERESQVEQAQKSTHDAEAIFAEKTAGWLGQKEGLLRSLERLKTERATVIPPISDENMKLYETIRKRKSGVAVTTAREGSCVVCGASIRPMELQSARIAQDLVYCTTCGRILYVG